MHTPSSDQGIPLLTEVIDPQATPQADAKPAPRTTVPAPPPFTAAAASLPVLDAPAPLTTTTPAATVAEPPAPALTPATPVFSSSLPLTPVPVPTLEPTPAPPARSPFSFTTPALPATPTTPLPERSFITPAPPIELAPPIAPSLLTPTPASSTPLTSTTEAPQANNTWQNSEFGELEKDLRERITRQVLGRIDFVLDHRVRSTLTDVVDSAIDTLALEIKRGLHETISEIVARAVTQELSRLQSSKK